jgi:lipopolysaccharide export system protein LptA
MEQIINGFANQIEYDSRTEILKLIGDALVKRLECEVAIDEITGGVIVYNAQTEQLTVDGKAPGDNSGRVRIIIQPRADGKAEPGAAGDGNRGQGAVKCPTSAPVSLRPSPKIEPTRGNSAAGR